eukprot:7318537-Prymnesium_polylepis.1
MKSNDPTTAARCAAPYTTSRERQGISASCAARPDAPHKRALRCALRGCAAASGAPHGTTRSAAGAGDGAESSKKKLALRGGRSDRLLGSTG